MRKIALVLVMFIAVLFLTSCAFSGIPVEDDEFILLIEHRVAGRNDTARFAMQGYSTAGVLTNGTITLICPCYDLENNGVTNTEYFAKSVQIGGEGDTISLQLLAPLAENDYYSVIVYLNWTRVDSFEIHFWGKRDDPQLDNISY